MMMVVLVMMVVMVVMVAISAMVVYGGGDYDGDDGDLEYDITIKIWNSRNLLGFVSRIT